MWLTVNAELTQMDIRPSCTLLADKLLVQPLSEPVSLLCSLHLQLGIHSVSRSSCCADAAYVPVSTGQSWEW
jgi:hypothetical protein